MPGRARANESNGQHPPSSDAAAAASSSTSSALAPVVLKCDLTRQGLTQVPREVLSLHSLTELNLMGNALTELPEAIGGLAQLTRLGLKDNALETLPQSIGNLRNLVELYLTNNHLTALPSSMGRLQKLRKLQASFNRLRTLPEGMRHMEALELFRAACNPELEDVPPYLAQAPALTWLSFGGSRFCRSRNAVHDDSSSSPSAPISASLPWWRQQGFSPVISLQELERGEKLGDGASGDVYRARWSPAGEVALKLFRGDTGPDGRCIDEVEVLCLVDHPGLTKVVVVVEDDGAHDDDASSQQRPPAGVIMDLVEGLPLADKPNASSVLRCRWAEGTSFSLPFVLSVGARVAGALQHLHAQGIMHGDVYAHNVVATPPGDGGGSATLLDYGASFLYPKDCAVDFERLEVRALGLLLADLLARCPESTGAVTVKTLVERCLSREVAARPTFGEIARAFEKALREVCSPRIPAEE